MTTAPAARPASTASCSMRTSWWPNGDVGSGERIRRGARRRRGAGRTPRCRSGRRCDSSDGHSAAAPSTCSDPTSLSSGGEAGAGAGVGLVHTEVDDDVAGRSRARSRTTRSLVAGVDAVEVDVAGAPARRVAVEPATASTAVGGSSRLASAHVPARCPCPVMRTRTISSLLGRRVGNRMTSRIVVHVGEQHHQPVDADAEAAGRRQAVLEGPQVVLVDGHRLVVARRLRRAPGPRSGRAARRDR